jgi:hypothetical protein
LVRIKTSGGAEDQRRLSNFHDKLLAALAGFNTQITAYTELTALPPNNVDIDLKKMLVYRLCLRKAVCPKRRAFASKEVFV